MAIIEKTQRLMIKKRKFNCVNVSTFLSTIAAIIIVLLTYFQLREFNNATKADFAHRFKTDFFTEQSCTLMTLFDNNLLKFEIISNKKDSLDFAYFTIDTSKIKVLKKKFPKVFIKTNYTAY